MEAQESAGRNALMLIHTLAHGPFRRNVLVAVGFAEEVVITILFNGYKIALSLSQQAAVAFEYIGMGNDIVRGSGLRQVRRESSETVQGKANEGNAGMGGVEFLVWFNHKALHGCHLPGEFLMRSRIAQLSKNIQRLHDLKGRLLNLLSRSQVIVT